MGAFSNLPQDKRDRIVNAAMGAFATHGYHKTSTADIAKAAAISKAMVFTYFGSKQGCYEFLCEEMVRLTLEEFDKFKGQLLSVTDYFERIILSSKIKVDLLKHCPSLMSFAMSMFLERDDKVRPTINRILSEAQQLREMFLLTGIDATKFQDPKDAPRVSKMTLWLSYGCAQEWSQCDSEAIDGILADFIDCMLALKNKFYKEEWIHGDD